MVARCYQEAGFDLKAIMGAQWCMTTVGWKDFATRNKQFIEEADLQPGDVIWYGRPSGNHMMMYAGNGQVTIGKYRLPVGETGLLFPAIFEFA